MVFPVHRDHDAYCLIKTQLHNSKTFLRRKELKIEKESLWYDTKFSICNEGVYLYIWILCVLERWRPMSGSYLLRATFLYPLHRRETQRTQLRGTLTELSVHDFWVLSSPMSGNGTYPTQFMCSVTCTLTLTHSIHKISSIECKGQVYTAVSIHTGLVPGVTQTTIDSH